MIRVIRMDRQVIDLPGHREFALWDTVNDRFLEFAGSQSWECLDELQTDLRSTLADVMAERQTPPDLDFIIAHHQRIVSLVASIHEYTLPSSRADD